MQACNLDGIMTPSTRTAFRKTLWKSFGILFGVLVCALFVWARAVAVPVGEQPEAGAAGPYSQLSAEVTAFTHDPDVNNNRA